MSTEPPPSIEDRLIHEILREQARGIDARFLQRLENAVDAGANPVRKPRPFPAIAKAAAVIFAGTALWWGIQSYRSASGNGTTVMKTRDSRIFVQRGSQNPTNRNFPMANHQATGLPKETSATLESPEETSTPLAPLSGPANRPMTGSLVFNDSIETRKPDLARHGWVSPHTHPISTFPVTTGNESYALIRRLIRKGRTIPAGAVRVEECINAFHYNYQAPVDPVPFAVTAEVASCPWNSGNFLVRIAIKARETNGPLPADPQMQVEINPAKISTYRLIGYSMTASDAAHFGRPPAVIRPGQTTTAFYEIEPAPAKRPIPQPLRYAARPAPDSSNDWLWVKLRHSGKDAAPLEFPLVGNPLPLASADADFRFATAVAMFALKLAGEENLQAISWQKISALARGATKRQADRQEFLKLLENPSLR